MTGTAPGQGPLPKMHATLQFCFAPELTIKDVDNDRLSNSNMIL